MSKRELETSHDDAAQKRQKTRHREPPEEVKSAEHLRELLMFQQDNVTRLLAGIRSFKALLDSILYTEDKESTTKQQVILKEFLTRQLPKDEGAVPLSNLFQAWRFAADARHDSLSSAISAILALLLKALSRELELSDAGLAIAKAVLREEHLALVTRGLQAAKEKAYVISPCLRLLNEIVLFDGGALASRVHAARQATLDPKLLARCLTLGAHDARDAEERKATIRSNCVRYLISLLKLSAPSHKKEVLSSPAVAKGLFGHLTVDSVSLISEFLDTVLEHVLKDERYDKQAKSLVVSYDNLSSVAALYRQDRPPVSPEKPALDAKRVAHKFLKYACTTLGAGILYPSRGFYPPGTDQFEEDDHQVKEIDLGLDSVPWYNNFDGHIRVNNVPLQRFLRTLKPYSSSLECDLSASIFEAAPELVADYFRGVSFSIDPKLTPTWIGFTSLLFRTIKVPTPHHFGNRGGYRDVPPPVSIVLDSILPPVMDQKTLTRCLTQQFELITFTATRLLIVAFQKLQHVLKCFDEASNLHGELWQEGKQRLLEAFNQRCPQFRHIVNIFHAPSSRDGLQRESILRLIRLYLEASPETGEEQILDVSTLLAQSLHELLDESHRERGALNGQNPPAEVTQDSPEDALKAIKLSHLLSIAARAPSTRWFHKPDQLPNSLFTCLLRIQASETVVEGSDEILKTIAHDNDVLAPRGVDALVASLRPTDTWHPFPDTFAWLDEVVLRYTKKPIKYLDDLEDISDEDGASISPLWMAIVEQWPFVLTREQGAENIAIFLSRVLESSRLVGSDAAVIQKIRESLVVSTNPKSLERKQLDLKSSQNADIQDRLDTNSQELSQENGVGSKQPRQLSHVAIDPSLFVAPPDPAESKSVVNALHKIGQSQLSDLTEAVQWGTISKLILCLSSIDHDVRSQARTHLKALIKRLGQPKVDSQFPHSKQIWLLLGILDNTVDSGSVSIKDEPLPFVITVFASMSAPILTEPTNPLYEQINKFLLRSPTFDRKTILLSWLHRFLRETPPDIRQPPKSRHSATPDVVVDDIAIAEIVSLAPTPLTTLARYHAFPTDPYHNGIHFFLSYIYHAMRGQTDLDLLRRSGVLESILAVAASDVFLPRSIRELIVALLWRIATLEGGSDILITRVGVITWLSGLINLRGIGKSSSDLVSRPALKQLLQRIWDTCDQAEVRAWDGGSLDGFKEAMGDQNWREVATKEAYRSHCGVEKMVQLLLVDDVHDLEDKEDEVNGHLDEVL